MSKTNLARVARQAVRGVPYLQKEIGRSLSIKTGSVLTTPSTYYVIFSGRCNLACTFCTIYKQKDPTLTEEVMHRIVREAKELSGSGFNISLSGGEPTIFKPTYSTLELAHKLGVNYGFTTNALALTPDNVRRILGWDPFNINVSLESTDPKINEALRPTVGGTKRTLTGIENVMAEKERIGARVSVIVKPTIMEQNYRGLPDLVRHFGKRSKVQINFQPFVGVEGDPHWVQDLDRLSGVLEELKAMQLEGYPIIANADVLNGFLSYFQSPPQQTHHRFLDLAGEKRNCDIGLRTMGVQPSGDVYFCDYLGKPVGNIYRQSLSEIYYGQMAGKQRGQMVHCNIDCQQTCKRPTPLLVKMRSFMRMG